jgi:hypothetical protein
MFATVLITVAALFAAVFASVVIDVPRPRTDAGITRIA